MSGFRSANALTLNATVDALKRLGCDPTPSGDGFSAYCPAHERDGNQHDKSLSVAKGKTQAVVFKCHAGCEFEAIRDALGLVKEATRNSGETVYSYQDVEGKEIHRKVRHSGKEFAWKHKDEATGEYKSGKRPHAAAVLYRLPELRKAIADGRTVYFCEGEKDTDRLTSLGLAATTCADGSGTAWKKKYNEQVQGVIRAVLLPDNDDAGRKHMDMVARELAKTVADVRCLALPNLPEKGDVSNWLDAGGTVEELETLADAAPSYEFAAPGDGAGNDEAERDDSDDTQRKELRRKQSEWLGKFVYVTTRDEYVDPKTATAYTSNAFKNIAERMFPAKWGKKSPASRFHQEQHSHVCDVSYWPGKDSLVQKGFCADGTPNYWLNTYRKPEWPEPKQDVEKEKLFLDHVRYISGGDERFMEQLLNWMATLVQKPGQRVHWVPLLISPCKGTGKGMLGKILTVLLGKQNVGKLDNHAIGGSFHDGLIGKQLLIIEEFHMFEDRNARLNEFKTWITEDHVPCNRKGKSQISVDNVANFIASSNFETAASIDPDERRYMVAINNQAAKPPEYYQALAKTFLPDYVDETNGRDGIAALLYMLMYRDLSTFDPYAPAIETEAREVMIRAGYSALQQEVMSRLERKEGLLQRDLIPFEALRAMIDAANHVASGYGATATPSNRVVGSTARAVGIVCLGQKRVVEGGGKACVYSLRNHERWRNASESEIKNYLDETRKLLEANKIDALNRT